MKAKVYLVGSGPGDPGLLTLNALRALESADYVLYDQLVSAEILALLPRRAFKECVDELPGKHPDRFAHIHSRMIEKALYGSTVVRLKSGDPMIFGRAGEEIEALRAAHIPYEVIPGITAGLAAAACLDLPLTHRMYSSSVTFVTGHECSAKGPSSLDWPNLAAHKGTLVFYMVAKNLYDIADNLTLNGKPGDTPVVFVQHAGRHSQRAIDATLGTVATRVAHAGLGSPAVLVVGPAAGLGGGKSAFQSRPLFGRRVLVTRPPGQAEELISLLQRKGARAEACPLIAVEGPTDRGPVIDLIDRLKTTREELWLIFTSANGVAEFRNRLVERGADDIRIWGSTRLAAIGSATARTLERLGFRPDIRAAMATSEALATELRPHLNGFENRVFLLQAEEGRETLLEEFGSLGIRKVPVYRQFPMPDASARLAGFFPDPGYDFPNVITVTSPNIVDALADSLDVTAKNEIHACRTKIASNAKRVTERVRERLGVEPIESETPYMEAMVEAIETYFTSLSALSAR